MKVVFMGTPEFAVPTLLSLYKENFEITAVITQPDKPKGRGKPVVAPQVKIAAEGLGLNVYQPKSIKEPEFIKLLNDINPEAIVVVAFGQILPLEILKLPIYGCINVHASLLPKLRGAAPINWSIINGDKTTGITTMYMDEGLDTGDIILQKAIEIGEEETAGELHDRLSVIGANTLIETLSVINNDKELRTKQNHENATYAPMLTKETGRIDWSLGAGKIKNLIRGTAPRPGAYSFYDGNMFKIYHGEAVEKEIINSDYGTINEVEKEYISIKCKEGFLKIREIQFQNKKRMTIEAYLRGNRILKGKTLS